MTTDCIDHLDVATRQADRRAERDEVYITATEWGLVAIIGIGFLLMLPAVAFLVSRLTA